MTESKRLELFFHSEDSGNCRVYYKTKKPQKGWADLYCFQEDTGDTFKFYECSRDGEPSHEIDTNHIMIMDQPRGKGGALCEQLDKWIANLKK